MINFRYEKVQRKRKKILKLFLYLHYVFLHKTDSLLLIIIVK